MCSSPTSIYVPTPTSLVSSSSSNTSSSSSSGSCHASPTQNSLLLPQSFPVNSHFMATRGKHGIVKPKSIVSLTAVACTPTLPHTEPSHFSEAVKHSVWHDIKQDW